MRRKLFFIIIVLSGFSNSLHSQVVNIIPKPQKVELSSGEFVLTSSTSLIVEGNCEKLEFAIKPLQTIFKNSFNRNLEIKRANKRSGKAINAVTVKLGSDFKPEGYALSIKPSGISIEASGASGVFYAIQSLRQLLPSNIESGNKHEFFKLKCLKIEDAPRFEYRGMHLDVGRHFFTADDVKTYIDMIALHKMNVFHWHLTEDQGWRIEIYKYPKLVSVGSVRDETVIGRNSGVYDGVEHKGYYTKKEIRDIVNYAEERFITLIPEIELPGHSLAALTSYPEFGCTGGPYSVRKKWGVSYDVYCAGNDKTFEFLENILSEVIELFPSKYIHIGGDECPKEAWKNCDKCQKRIKSNGLKNENELQSYFVRRIEKFLNSKGKTIIGWDEILEGGVAPNAVVMSWRGIKGGIVAANQNHKVIMTPDTHCYFDHYQSKGRREPHAIGGFTDVEKVYSYEPVPKELSDDQVKYILGAQANVWTEYISYFPHVQYMCLPRMSALSEVVWTKPENKDYNDFKDRMKFLFERFDALGYSSAKHILNEK